MPPPRASPAGPRRSKAAARGRAFGRRGNGARRDRGSRANRAGGACGVIANSSDRGKTILNSRNSDALQGLFCRDRTADPQRFRGVRWKNSVNQSHVQIAVIAGPRPPAPPRKNGEGSASMARSSSLAMAPPTFSRGTVCALSTMSCDACPTPLRSAGATAILNSGASAQSARHRQDRHRGMLGEQIGLDHDRRTRLAIDALQGDDHEIATGHSQPSRSATPSSQSRICFSRISSRDRSDCRRHSTATPVRLVAGTQIRTGRMPVRREAARWRLTRSAACGSKCSGDCYI